MKKISLVLLICLLITDSFAVVIKKHKKEWFQYKKAFKKVHRSDTMESKAYENFLKNLEEINKNNADYKDGKVSSLMGLNQFSDMSTEEFISKFNTYKPIESQKQSKSLRIIKLADSDLKLPSYAALPASVNWTAQGHVNPIQNQGQCGSCWTFTCLATLESQIYRATGKLVKLSEQHLTDCSKATPNDGCDGGNVNVAFSYIQTNGISNITAYPYTSGQSGYTGTCQYQSQNNIMKQLNINIMGIIDIPQNETIMQQFVGTYGPISVAICASNSNFKSYKGGIYTSTCSKIDHAVNIVGYGIDAATGTPYWIVRNSWGTSWGENGYMRLIMNQNALQIASTASYAYLRTQDAPTATMSYSQCNLGCYSNPGLSYRLPGTYSYLKTQSPVEECVKACSNNGNTYAGIQGRICFCQNIYTQYGSAQSSNCLTACATNPFQLCGGATTMSVYGVSCTLSAMTVTGTTKATTPTPATSSTSSSLSTKLTTKISSLVSQTTTSTRVPITTSPNSTIMYPQCYLGCYSNPNRYYYTPGKYGMIGSRNPSPVSSCLVFCKGYLYAGLQNNLCLCQNIYSPYGAALTSSCVNSCPSNLNQSCGSIRTVMIYSVSCSSAYSMA